MFKYAAIAVPIVGAFVWDLAAGTYKMFPSVQAQTLLEGTTA